MKRLLRWLGWGVAIFAVLVLVMVLAKDALLKGYIQRRLQQETGHAVHIGRLEVGLLKPTLVALDFRMDHPPELGGGPLLVIPELRLEYDRSSVSKKELRIISAVLNVAEVNAVTAPNQRSFLERLQERLDRSKNEKWREKFKGIDTLTLTVGRVRERKLRSGKVEEINVGITNRVFKDIRSEADLGPLVAEMMVRSIMNGFTAPPAQR